MFRARLALVPAAAIVAASLGAAAVAEADTVTFLPTGAEQTFNVPAGVTSLRVVAVGGRGGTGGSFGAVGGFGALVAADLPVTPGQILYVEVGGNGGTGDSGGSGGFNGGGAGGNDGDDGGGGGGASDVRTATRAAGTSLLTRLVTAAGGGGGGSASTKGVGGAAGAPGSNGFGGIGGQPGTLLAGGSAGGGGECRGIDGAVGSGGAGGTGCGTTFSGGGGGGGGVYGGGGGSGSSDGGGGGGGSSGFAATASNPSVSTDTTGLPSISITYTPPAGGGGGGGGGGGTTPPPPSDATAPVGSALRLLPSAFRPLTSGGPVAAARGTSASYALTEAATVRFTITRARPGRRVGGRCVRSRPSNATRPRCTRYVTLRGSFARAGVAGTNRFRFSGRIRGRALSPGRHRLRAVPTDPAGNRGTRFSAAFRILR